MGADRRDYMREYRRRTKSPPCPAYLAKMPGGERAWADVWKLAARADRQDAELVIRIEAAARMLATTRLKPNAAMERELRSALGVIEKRIKAGARGPAKVLPFLQGLPKIDGPGPA